MARKPTFPIIFDECNQIIISDLLNWGYLTHSSFRNGTISWSRNGVEQSSISVIANTKEESRYLELVYIYNEQLIKYRVQLTTLPSNLGKGVLWYFICPKSGKRCRKLHFVNGYFYHRAAFKGCIYKTQNISIHNREIKKAFDSYFGREKIIQQLNSKHFKNHYAGKPTKQFLRLTKKIDAYQEILYEEYLRITSH